LILSEVQNPNTSDQDKKNQIIEQKISETLEKLKKEHIDDKENQQGEFLHLIFVVILEIKYCIHLKQLIHLLLDIFKPKRIAECLLLPTDYLPKKKKI